MKPTSKLPAVQLDQLAEAVRAGVVLAMADRAAADVSGGMLPNIGTTMGYFPTEPIGY